MQILIDNPVIDNEFLIAYCLSVLRPVPSKNNTSHLGSYLAGLIEGDGSIFDTTNVKNLSPYWVTGFSDAESSFTVSIFKSKDRKTGWRVIPNFCILLHPKDKELLIKLQSFFSSTSIDVRLGPHFSEVFP